MRFMYDFVRTTGQEGETPDAVFTSGHFDSPAGAEKVLFEYFKLDTSKIVQNGFLTSFVTLKPATRTFKYASYDIKHSDGSYVHGEVKPFEIKVLEGYDAFQLKWMAENGYSIGALIESLTNYQYKDPEDITHTSKPICELFKEWLAKGGFGCDIWPSKDEWEHRNKMEAQDDRE